MVDAWPVGLPQRFEVSGYSEAEGDGVLEYGNDAGGPPQMRRRSSAAPRPLSGTMTITRAQLATLRTFVETTLIGGTLPFTLPGQSDDSTWLVRFTKAGLPKWSALGGNWFSVSMGLLILP